MGFIHRQQQLFTCPFCGHSSHYLLATGHTDEVLTTHKVVGGGRRYAKCLYCGSVDRDRLVYLYLRDHTSTFSTPGKVLHIAPEKCLSRELKAHFGDNYVAADKFTSGYKHAYSRGTINMDITSIPINDNQFSLIICNHVLEHIVDDAKAMSEIYRVLSPGGMAIMQVPISTTNATTIEDNSITSAKGRKRAFGQFDHVRLYGLDYSQRLLHAGFNVEIKNISALYPSACLNLLENLFICHK